MPDFEGVNGVAAGDIEKINAIAKADIENLNGIDTPASGVTAQADIDHWWKMNTGIGADIADEIASKDLAVTNATSVSATSWKGASLDVIDFDGSGDHIDVDGSTAFTGGVSGDISFAFWMYPTATPGNYKHFFAMPTHATQFWTTAGLGLYFASSNLNFWANHYNSKKATITMPASDEWHHVACVLNVDPVSPLIRIYVTTKDAGTGNYVTASGTDSTSTTGGAAIVHPLDGDTTDITTLKFAIGGHFSSYHTAWRVSDFRVYGKTLSEAEVQAISGHGTDGSGADFP